MRSSAAGGGKPSKADVVRLQRVVRRLLAERRQRTNDRQERAAILLQKTMRLALARRRLWGWGKAAFQRLEERWPEEDGCIFCGLMDGETERGRGDASSERGASAPSSDEEEGEEAECVGEVGDHTGKAMPYLLVGGGVDGGKPWWAVVTCWSKWSKYYKRTEIYNESSYWGMCPSEVGEHFARPEEMVATIGIGKAAEIALGKIGGCIAFEEQLPQIVCREAATVQRILEGSIFDTTENSGNPIVQGKSNGWTAWSASWVERMGQRWVEEGRAEAPVVAHGPRALGSLLRKASSRKGISKHAEIMNPDAVAYLTGRDYKSWQDVLDDFEFGDPLFSDQKTEKTRIKEHLTWLRHVDDTGTATRVGIPGELYLDTHHNGWWQPGQQPLTPINYCAKYPECPDEEEAAIALRAEQAYFEAVDEVHAAIRLVCGPTASRANTRRAVAAEKRLVQARLTLASQLPWMKSPWKFYYRVEGELAECMDLIVEASPQYAERISSVSVDGRWPLGRIIAAEFTGEWVVKCVMREVSSGLLDANIAAWYANKKVSRYEMVEGEGSSGSGEFEEEWGSSGDDQGSDESSEEADGTQKEDGNSQVGQPQGAREALGTEGGEPGSSSKVKGSLISTTGVATGGGTESPEGIPGEGESERARGAKGAAKASSKLSNSSGRRSGGGS